MDELVRDYAQYARNIAKQYSRKCFSYLRDEMEGWAMEGLLQAACRYETHYGVSFTTFATPRIRGAISDGLRVWLGRSRKGEPFKPQAAYESHDYPDPVVDHSDLSWLRRSWNGGIDTYVDTQFVAWAIEYLQNRFDKREFDALMAPFFGIPKQDVAASYGVDPSRVSQLRKRALDQLKADPHWNAVIDGRTACAPILVEEKSFLEVRTPKEKYEDALSASLHDEEIFELIRQRRRQRRRERVA